MYTDLTDVQNVFTSVYFKVAWSQLAVRGLTYQSGCVEGHILKLEAHDPICSVGSLADHQQRRELPERPDLLIDCDELTEPSEWQPRWRAWSGGGGG